MKSPCERLLCEIGFATFPPCDFPEVTRASSECPSPLLEPDLCFRHGILLNSIRIPFENAVRGDGIRYKLSDGSFWGVLARVGPHFVYVLTPSETGVCLLKIDVVRIKEILRYA